MNLDNIIFIKAKGESQTELTYGVEYKSSLVVTKHSLVIDLPLEEVSQIIYEATQPTKRPVIQIVPDKEADK